MYSLVGDWVDGEIIQTDGEREKIRKWMISESGLANTHTQADWHLHTADKQTPATTKYTQTVSHQEKKTQRTATKFVSGDSGVCLTG